MSKKTKADRQVGQRIKDRRLALGLSQRSIATQHVTCAYLSRIEAGLRVPSWSALLELAPKVKTTALFLATGQEHDCPFCGRA
jgi:transcriptional regulator with XRE-family HTH domain